MTVWFKSEDASTKTRNILLSYVCVFMFLLNSSSFFSCFRFRTFRDFLKLQLNAFQPQTGSTPPKHESWAPSVKHKPIFDTLAKNRETTGSFGTWSKSTHAAVGLVLSERRRGRWTGGISHQLPPQLANKNWQDSLALDENQRWTLKKKKNRDVRSHAEETGSSHGYKQSFTKGSGPVSNRL